MTPPSLREVLEGKMEGEEWYFTEDGVRFISNIYEIAPYAEGETLYDIPYELVNDVRKNTEGDRKRGNRQASSLFFFVWQLSDFTYFPKGYSSFVRRRAVRHTVPRSSLKRRGRA